MITAHQQHAKGSRRPFRSVELFDYTLYADGIELHKTNGKPDVYLMDPPNAEYIAALIRSTGSLLTRRRHRLLGPKDPTGTNVHSGGALRWAIAFLSVIPELTLGT
jgi:hypothetical protein